MTLNFVFENWKIGEDEPNTNLLKNYESRSIHNSMRDSFNYMNYRLYRLEEIKNYPDENFYFFISSLSISVASMLYKLSENVIEYFKNYDNLYLMIINEHEYETKETLLEIETECIKKGINLKKVWVINNNSKLKEHKEKLKLSINIHSVKAISIFTSNDLSSYEPFEIKTKKDNFFLSLNRSPKEHRYALIYMLLKSGLINDTDWSFLDNIEILNGFKSNTSHIFNNEEIRLLNTEIQYVYNIQSKNSKYETNFKWSNNITCTKQTYENAYVNITGESYFYGNEIHITEKSFKPFFFLQYPLILASPNHIKELKKHTILIFLKIL